MTPSDLKHKYDEIIQADIDLDTCVSGECVSTLYSSEWVTIIVIRFPEPDMPCSIEVEVSFPTCVIDPSPSQSNEVQKEAREFTYSAINHLRYLLDLLDIGFTLGIISTEGIWSAVIEINEPPDDSFFVKLIPPMMQ